MRFDPILAEIRFGCGLSPLHAPAQSVDEMMRRLRAADKAAKTFPIPDFDDLRPRLIELAKLRRQRKSDSESERMEARDQTRSIRKEFVAKRHEWLAYTLGRRAFTEDGFRERLMFFWADHFTARGDGAINRRAVPAYWEEAIRPNLLGSFRDMLIAAATHPMMLMFLNQNRSFGPNSKAAKNRNKMVGLNENLAREVMELHTLGAGGPYTQDDVRQLAELFTGLSFQPRKGFFFRKKLAEPGSEHILGKYYGGDPALLAHVYEALTDLARHPATARHIAWKLAVHFVSDKPDPRLIEAMAQRFLETDGNLEEVYRTLLSHPAAWSPELSNVKQPIEYISSAMRALAISPKQIKKMRTKRVRQYLMLPMEFMGQDWNNPIGPDGWAEEDGNWVTPQGMAARMQWALVAPQVLKGKLPDPREFVHTALGDTVPEAVTFAARAAESRWEGVALVLASPSFQRR